jgi:hypothetical protein
VSVGAALRKAYITQGQHVLAYIHTYIYIYIYIYIYAYERIPCVIDSIYIELARRAEEAQNKIGLAALCHGAQEALVVLVQLH